MPKMTLLYTQQHFHLPIYKVVNMLKYVVAILKISAILDFFQIGS